MQVFELLGSTLGLAFVAGIRLYATVLAVGLGLHLGLLHLPRHLEGLAILAHPVVIAAAAIAYVAEFFADKIPWVDTLWDSVHLLIRPLGAALLAFAAVGTLDPVAQILVVLLGGGVALSTHSTKAGFRLLVNHSPEPFSNVGVSVAEDVFALAMTWLALVHPLVSLGAIAVMLAGIALIAPKLFRLLRVEALAAAALVRYWCGIVHTESPGGDPMLVRGVAGRGVGVPRNSVGVLLLAEDGLRFLTRAGLRRRQWHLPLDRVRSLTLQPRLLFDRLTVESDQGTAYVHLFKDHGSAGHRMADAVRASRQSRVADAGAAR